MEHELERIVREAAGKASLRAQRDEALATLKALPMEELEVAFGELALFIQKQRSAPSRERKEPAVASAAVEAATQPDRRPVVEPVSGSERSFSMEAPNWIDLTEAYMHAHPEGVNIVDVTRATGQIRKNVSRTLRAVVTRKKAELRGDRWYPKGRTTFDWSTLSILAARAGIPVDGRRAVVTKAAGHSAIDPVVTVAPASGRTVEPPVIRRRSTTYATLIARVLTEANRPLGTSEIVAAVTRLDPTAVAASLGQALIEMRKNKRVVAIEIINNGGRYVLAEHAERHLKHKGGATHMNGASTGS